MNGDRVKAAIQASGRTIEQAATSMHVSREHFNRLLNGDRPIPEKYILKLKQIGVELPGDVIKSDVNGASSDPGFYERAMQYLKDTFEEAIEAHKETVQSKEENLRDIRENNKGILYTNKELTDSHRTYRRMVDMCLDAGIIIPNSAKTTVKK
jgi:transcriptional regulator with XRE-family HTH domain